MSTSGARRVWFDDRSLWVELDDGRTLEIALSRYPRLLNATASQRERFWIGYEGQGLHWEEIDEDISVARLIERERDASGAKTVAAE